MDENEIFDRAESCVIAYNENATRGWLLRDYIRESLRAATAAAEQRERKACAALVYEYGDVSAYEAILRRNKGPLFRDEKKS